MRFGDAGTGAHQGGGFGLHRAAATDMQGELALRGIMLDGGGVEQWFDRFVIHFFTRSPWAGAGPVLPRLVQSDNLSREIGGRPV